MIIENFRSRAWQRAQPRGLELLEVGFERKAKSARTVHDFQRRECMDVHVWYRRLDRAANLEISVAVKARMNAALEADFGGAAIPGFGRPPTGSCTDRRPAVWRVVRCRAAHGC